MKVKAKASYRELSNEDNFLALGSASTHLKLIAGESVEVGDVLLPFSKELGECLTEIKSKKGDK